MRSQYEAFQALNTDIVIISFGTDDGIKAWLQETQIPFPVLLDPERVAYQAYGLERSLLRSWGLRAWWGYARLLLTGYQWRGIQGDSGQLGGDFIVEAGGILRFIHTSRDPVDRPVVSGLLAVLEELHG